MDSSEDEAPPPLRSRSTRYRREGGKKRRRRADAGLDDISDESEDRANESDIPEEFIHHHDATGAATESSTSDEEIFLHNVNVVDAPSESDSEWSDELNTNIIEERGEVEEENDNENSDNDPNEMEFVVDDEADDNPDNPPPGNGDSDLDDDNENHFDFSHQSLNKVLEFRQVRTVKESLLITLALSLHHNQDYEFLLNSLMSMNILFGDKFFPTCKKALWRILGRNSSGVEAHVYCSHCSFYIGKKKRQGQVIECPVCEVTFTKDAANNFITVSLKKQLKHFLSLPNAYDMLRYRETRSKHEENAIEDMFDGEHYKSVKVDGQGLENSTNYTFTINTDGCKIRKGAKTSTYPVFVRLNELPPKLRQKYMFLVGVYADNKEPNMQCFLKPVVAELNSLAVEGMLWKPDGFHEVRSKFITICFCVDGKARWQILNMTAHSGHYACTLCTYCGVSINNVMRYPCAHPELPAYELRTDRGMKRDMVQAQSQNVSVRGHRGITPLACLKGLDLVKGGGFDDLHYFYECAALHNTMLILKEAPRIMRNMGYDSLCSNIDGRMKRVKTPSCIF